MITRRFTAANLLREIMEARQELENLPEGGIVQWHLPPGDLRLPFGISLGTSRHSLSLFGTESRIRFVTSQDELMGDAGEAALLLTGRRVWVEGLELGVRGSGNRVGLRVRAEESAVVRATRLMEINGERVTGMDVEAPRVDLRNLRLAGLGAESSVTGIRARALSRLTLGEVDLTHFTAHRVRGLVLGSPDGRAGNIRIRGLDAGDGHPLPVELEAGTEISIEGVSVRRRLEGPDLESALITAQENLAGSPPGTSEVWTLPSGEFALTQALDLGMEGISLTLSGRSDLCVLNFGTIDDGSAAVSLTGRDLKMENIAVMGRSAGSITGVQMAAADLAIVDDLTLRGLRGTEVVGIRINAGRADVSDLTVTGARASDGSFHGAILHAFGISLHRMEIRNSTAMQNAIGIKARAENDLTATGIETRRITGDRACGADLRVRSENGRIVLLDASARHVETPADGREAIGISLMSGGDVEMRGLQIQRVAGARAAGMLVASAGGINWLAGEIRNIRGLNGGAAGARLVGSESDRKIRIADIHVEAVRATETGETAVAPSSWQSWWESGLSNDVDPDDWPSGEDHHEDVAGLHLSFFVAEIHEWIARDPGAIFLTDSILRRISGTALQIDGGLRDIEVDRSEAWTSLRGGWMNGERVRLSQLTWHRHHTGIVFGPSALTTHNSLITAIQEGAGIVLNETEVVETVSTYVQGEFEFFLPVLDPLPYILAGPLMIPPSMHNGALAPNVPVDLRIASDYEWLDGQVPEDGFIGAHEPDTPARCDLTDPLPPSPEPVPDLIQPSPVVDYRARDARSLTALMLDRAGVVMPKWKERNPADQITMLAELLAFELDKLAYRQEVAVSEGYLSTALSRRSVEDHARLVDYFADPGLSATTIMQFDIDEEGMAALNLDPNRTLTIPEDTMVINPDALDDVSLIFCTEATLEYDPLLRPGLLALDRPIEKGAVTAVLAGDLLVSGGGEGSRPRIDSERWLVFTPDDPDRPSLVVRVVSVEIGTDTTTIFWDPRRPAQVRYAPGSTRIHANVIPAHHGILLTPLSDTVDTGSPGFGAMSTSQELLRPWREKMTIEVENEGEPGMREVELPFSPVSMWASGWPLPDDAGKKGTPRIEVWVDGESWKRVDHLFMAKAGEDCFALRPGKGGGSVLRFGDGVNGSSLPRGQVIIDLRMCVGLGEAGNVGPDALTKVLVFGDGREIDEILPADADREEKISMHLKTTNVVAAVGGREPESLEQIRYNAPRGVRDVLSAVSLADYERLLESLPETASARAVFVDAGLRGIVRITLLLRDEDTLVREELGKHSEAERLRRWAVVRHHLETIRLLGFDVELVPPRFVPLDLDLVVDAHEWAISSRLERQVVSALRDNGGLFDPDVSGLGGDVFVDRIHQAVLAVVGVAAVRVKRLRRLTPNAPDFAGESYMPIGSDEVAVLRNPHGDGEDGLVTVTVCGGIS